MGIRKAIKSKKPSRNPTISLRCLPTEIRDLILENLLTLPKLTYLEKQPESPAIIVALRPDSEFYQEALQIYYKQNTFRITTYNFEAIQQLKTPYLASIRDLIVGDLYCDDPDYIDFVTNSKSRHMDFTTNTKSRITEFTNLETLCLSTDFPRVKSASDGPPVSTMRTLLARNAKIRKLEFWTPQGYWTTEQAILSGYCMDSILRQEQRSKIVKGHECSGPFLWKHRMFGVSVWEAGAGKTLELLE